MIQQYRTTPVTYGYVIDRYKGFFPT